MVVTYPILYREMNRIGITTLDLADAINTTEDTILNKLHGKAPWTLYEALTVCKILNFSDIKQLFIQFDSNI